MSRAPWSPWESGGGIAPLRADTPSGYWLATLPDDPAAPEPGEPARLCFYPAGTERATVEITVAHFDATRVPTTPAGIA